MQTQTRNLTYLGSPFGEGKGEAFILPKGNENAYFAEFLKRAQDKKAAADAAKLKEKAAQEKALNDWSINYWIGHQAHFTPRVKEVHDKGVELMAQGYDLKDMSKKPVADWVKEQYDIEQEAKLSTQFGKMGDEWNNTKPEERAKYTIQSQKALDKYFAENPEYSKDMANVVSKMPQRQPREKMPEYFKNNDDIKTFNATIPEKIYDITDLTEKNKKADEYAKMYVENGKTQLSPNIEEFDASPDPIAARDKFLETRAEEVKKAILDKGALVDDENAAKKIAEDIRHNKATEGLGARMAALKEKEFKALSTSMGNGFDEFVEGLASGDPTAFAFAQPSEISNGLFTTTIKTGSGDNATESTVIVRPRFVDGAEVAGGEDGEKYVAFDYYDPSEPDKKIEGNVYGKGSSVNVVRVQDANGNPDQAGKQYLAGAAAQNFNGLVKATGFGYGTPVQVGNKYFNIDKGVLKGNVAPAKTQTKEKEAIKIQGKVR